MSFPSMITLNESHFVATLTTSCRGQYTMIIITGQRIICYSITTTACTDNI